MEWRVIREVKSCKSHCYTLYIRISLYFLLTSCLFFVSLYLISVSSLTVFTCCLYQVVLFTTSKNHPPKFTFCLSFFCHSCPWSFFLVGVSLLRIFKNVHLLFEPFCVLFDLLLLLLLTFCYHFVVFFAKVTGADPDKSEGPESIWALSFSRVKDPLFFVSPIIIMTPKSC